jgi:hypothetical protein
VVGGRCYLVAKVEIEGPTMRRRYQPRGAAVLKRKILEDPCYGVSLCLSDGVLYMRLPVHPALMDDEEARTWAWEQLEDIHKRRWAQIVAARFPAARAEYHRRQKARARRV